MMYGAHIGYSISSAVEPEINCRSRCIQMRNVTWQTVSVNASLSRHRESSSLWGLSLGGRHATWLSVNDSGTHTPSPSDILKSTKRLPRCRCRPCNHEEPNFISTFHTKNYFNHNRNQTSLGILFNSMEPLLQKDKILLEKVHYWFTRMFPHLRSLPYEERLRRLGLCSLEERRIRAHLIEIFKMIKGLNGVSWSFFFHTAEDRTTRDHSWKLVRNHCRCKRLQLFSQRVVNRWNSLSEDDVGVPSVKCFKIVLRREDT